MSATSTRRAVLANAAAALSVPAIAANPNAPEGFSQVSHNGAVWFKADGPDPIFAAIERWRRAYAFFEECLDKKNALEDPYWDRRRELEALIDENKDEAMDEVRKVTKRPDMSDDEAYWHALETARRIAKNEHREVIAKVEELEQHGLDAESQAKTELLDTVPTTSAGAEALIKLLLEGDEAEFEDDDLFAALENLKEFLRPTANTRK